MSGKEKIAIGIIVLLIILIPVGSLLLAQRFKAQAPNPTPLPQSSPREVPKLTPLDELKKSLGATGSGVPSTPGPEVSFGPTLNFKIAIEGRPKNKQAAKIFLGIAAGTPVNNPQYLLSFTIDVPDTGVYTGLSLAGLTQGSNYTAYLKGPAQIASSSAFLVKPTVTDLGKLNLVTGDLNEDNVINSLDYAVAKNAYGATSQSAKWNANADFNLDGVINAFDLGIIIKNLAKTGNSGVWISTPPASHSGILMPPNTGSPSGSQPPPPPGSHGGYWMWFPTAL